jgi:hypothetical protein
MKPHPWGISQGAGVAPNENKVQNKAIKQFLSTLKMKKSHPVHSGRLFS